MPYPPAYTGGQDDDQPESIRKVHIQPSILEGTFGVKSIYGPGTTLPLYRYPPVNTSAPYLVGDAEIPGVITCYPGTWTGSPSPQYAYQWMGDGVDLAGETNQVLNTTVTYDGMNITCEVRGYNTQGEDYALSSNSIDIALIEPIELVNFDTYVISGLAQGEQKVTLSQAETMVISGVSAENRLDINRSVAYFISGISAENRSDINAMYPCVISGLGATDRQDILGMDTYVIITDDYEALVDGVPQALHLLNFDAELSEEGWTVTGEAKAENDAAYNANYSFHGGYNIGPGGTNTPYSTMHQDLEMSSLWETDIDAGSCYLELNWYQYSVSFQDECNVRVEFYNSSMTYISEDTGIGLWASPDSIWFLREDEIPIPVNTRYIRIIMEFQVQTDLNNHNGFIDFVHSYIRKGDKIVNRDFGPTFDDWRIRFTLHNTYSGAALAELEFRDGIGGTDLCTGGSIIYGSVGLSKINADQAFDDVRDIGYWAGQYNAITLGTAWVGYSLPSPDKPLEIDITSRLGDPEGKQVGKEFILEGRDTGGTWIPVQKYTYDEVGDFGSQEQKQFVVNDGAYGFYHDEAGASGYTYDTDRPAYYDGYLSKGMLYQAFCRMDITHIAVRTTSATYGYKLYLVRWNQQKQNLGNNIGMISEILETITVASGARSDDWEEHALSQTYEFEVGDNFGIICLDTTAAGGEGDRGQVTMVDLNGGSTPYQLLRNAYLMAPWAGSSSDMYVGLVNSESSPHDWGYAVDFRGNYF